MKEEQKEFQQVGPYKKYFNISNLSRFLAGYFVFSTP